MSSTVRHKIGVTKAVQTFYRSALIYLLSSCMAVPGYAAHHDGGFDAGLHEHVALPGYGDRPYDVFIPGNLSKPAPALLVLHGGGSDASNAIRMTCPGGDVTHLDCITNHAAQNGYIAIFPRGTSRRLLKRVRTWNAGGGDAGNQWICTSGLACKNNVDENAYFNALLDALDASSQVDMKSVYVTGISNGAAMAHRLACEMPRRIAAIAAVAGANQVSAVQGCKPDRPVPVLQIHGTADCAWRYSGGVPNCVGAPRFEGEYIGVERSMRVWRDINGCANEFVATELPDRMDDGTRVTRFDWRGCQAPLVGYRITDGGHAWPNGYQYLSARRIGRVTRELTNDQIWQFLASHRLSE